MKEKVMEYLKQVRFESPKTPTQIGMALGKSYALASSSVSPALKKLVADGKVKRGVLNPGRIVYSWLRD